MFSMLVFSALVAVLVWVTLRGKDAWPFSHYPMFSSPADLSQLRVIRLALETRDGEVIWWRSRFYRYPERVGRHIKRTYHLEQEPHGYARFAPLQRRRYLAEALRLIRLEEGSLERYRAVHIVERTAAEDPAQGVVIHQQTLARIPLAELQGIHSGH
jgi:hypothetical protein